MSDKKQFTHFAGEFYVLSILNMLGIENYLTLGNKKGVDIVFFHNNKKFLIEVKAVRKGPWLIGKKNPTLNATKDHNKFYAFIRISDEKKIQSIIPKIESFIIPESEILKNELFVETKKGFVLHDLRKKHPTKGSDVEKEVKMRCSKFLEVHKEKWDLLLI